jgi:hypothetical protein
MHSLIQGGRPIPELRCNVCGALIARYELDQNGQISNSPVLPVSIGLSSTGLLPCPRCRNETDISLVNFCLNWYRWVIDNTNVRPRFI